MKLKNRISISSWTDIDAKKFPEFDKHRSVKRFEDKNSGLIGFIAIHNNNLGPAVGGTRMFPYPSEKEAISDVLRLSRAMTYKCALAGVRYGGGKAVIIGYPSINKTEDFLKFYAEKICEINKIESFHTGEDVGIDEDDVQFMLKHCSHFIGKRGLAGDPSPFSGLSVFDTMQVALEEVFGSNDISNHSVAIKGVGKVGGELLRLLLNVGAKVVISDTNSSVVDEIKKKYPNVEIVETENIYSQRVDIFSPCALGNDLNGRMVKEIKAKIICGGANNQLSSIEVGDEIYKRGILYVPDYLANAGGLINVVDEMEEGGYNRKRVLKRIDDLKSILKSVFTLSRQKNQPCHRTADRIAEDVFNGKSNL